MLQLINGDVQAVINDTPVTQAYISKQEGKIKIVGDKIEADALMHSAVQKGNSELLEKINAGLKKVQEDGTYEELLTKWFSQAVEE